MAVAVADEQLLGRGRHGRTWSAPPGAALLLSAGFRPQRLPAAAAWRLGAIVALAMVDAAEEVAGLREGTIGLKWPNDLVTSDEDGGLRKLAGLLGESVLEAERVDTAVIGVGINADWPADAFPADLAGSMTSLREASGGRPIDRDQLLEGFLRRLEPRYEALLSGRFDAAGWSALQRTTGAELRIDLGDGSLEGVGAGVDPHSGALLLQVASGVRPVDAGDVVRCRLSRQV